jgi:small-conductance mechanosensitive channel
MDNDNWTILSLKEYLESVIKTHDEKNTLQFQAMQTAVTKAEAATEKRFEGVNEFRGQLSDQSRTLMPRSEYEANHQNLLARVEQLDKQIEKSENLKQGGNQIWILIIGIVGFAIGMISFAIDIFGKIKV